MKYTLITLALVLPCALAIEKTKTSTVDQDRQVAAAEAVAPGLVKWHPNRADALLAAKNSGKPVFVFQMLGRLDELFC